MCEVIRIRLFFALISDLLDDGLPLVSFRKVGRGFVVKFVLGETWLEKAV